MPPESRRDRRWVGIDEAGYGPNLGPLVMTAVMRRGARRSRPPDLWADLPGRVSRAGGPIGSGSTTPRPSSRPGGAAIASTPPPSPSSPPRASPRRPPSPRCSPASGRDARRRRTGAVDRARETIPSSVARSPDAQPPGRLRRMEDRRDPGGGRRPGPVQCRSRRHGPEIQADLRAFSRLLRPSGRHLRTEAIVRCDKHGGRPLLRAAPGAGLPRGHHHARCEGPALSRYTLTARGRRCTWSSSHGRRRPFRPGRHGLDRRQEPTRSLDGPVQRVLDPKDRRAQTLGRLPDRRRSIPTPDREPGRRPRPRSDPLVAETMSHSPPRKV